LNIIIADNSGFCFGVNRAINKANAELAKGKGIYSLGSLIHNPEVIDDLANKGLQTINDVNDCENNQNILIRTHGVPENIYEVLKCKNANIIDMTCPFVKRVQFIANKYYKEGYKIIIIGDKKHPEVIGVNGWVDNSAIIFESADTAKKLKPIDNACVVAQTTLNEDTFNKIVDILKDKVKNIKVFNTICNATKDRQKSAYELSKYVEMMIVIGGYNSSNTKKLYSICKGNCNNTIFVENKDELPKINYKKYANIGITAGASTPDWIIQEVIKKLNDKAKD